MDRRQLLVATGTVVSAGLAGCAGEEETPDTPYIPEDDGSDIGTDDEGNLAVNVIVVNPTDETVELEVWVQLLDENGSEIDQGSTRAPIDPNTPADADPIIVFFGSQINESDVADHETALTAQGEESPF